MPEPIDFVSRKADIEARRRAEIPLLNIVGYDRIREVAYNNAHYIAKEELRKLLEQSADPYKHLYLELLYQTMNNKLAHRLPIPRNELARIVTMAIKDVYKSSLDERHKDKHITDETYWRSLKWLEEFIADRQCESLGPEL